MNKPYKIIRLSKRDKLLVLALMMSGIASCIYLIKFDGWKRLINISVFDWILLVITVAVMQSSFFTDKQKVIVVAALTVLSLLHYTFW